jgi:hypothetical protein
MAPFTTTQCRGWTLLGCRVGRYPWSRWRVGTKGASVTYLHFLGIRRTWGFTRPPPLRG